MKIVPRGFREDLPSKVKVVSSLVDVLEAEDWGRVEVGHKLETIIYSEFINADLLLS